jgi:hypothetical protein
MVQQANNPRNSVRRRCLWIRHINVATLLPNRTAGTSGKCSVPCRGCWSASCSCNAPRSGQSELSICHAISVYLSLSSCVALLPLTLGPKAVRIGEPPPRARQHQWREPKIHVDVWLSVGHEIGQRREASTRGSNAFMGYDAAQVSARRLRLGQGT